MKYAVQIATGEELLSNLDGSTGIVEVVSSEVWNFVASVRFWHTRPNEKKEYEMTVIKTFQDAQGNHTPLSNFYHSPFYAPFFGRSDEIHLFPTVEHYYQSSKAKSRADALHVLSQPTPGAAKRAGRAVDMLFDWDDIKLEVMQSALKKKFTFSNALGLSGFLMETNPYGLVEGNTWGDTFWGICQGVGENHLGILLMHRRDQLFSYEMAKSSYR